MAKEDWLSFEEWKALNKFKGYIGMPHYQIIENENYMLFENIKKIIEENGGELTFEKNEWDKKDSEYDSFFLAYRNKNNKRSRLRLRKDVIKGQGVEEDIKNYMAKVMIKKVFEYLPDLGMEDGDCTTPGDSI